VRVAENESPTLIPSMVRLRISDILSYPHDERNTKIGHLA